MGDACIGVGPAHRDTQALCRHDHGEVTLAVGAQDPCPVVGQPLHQRRVGMPVRVVRTHADQRHHRVHGGDQVEILVRRPVVGDLQDVRPQHCTVHIGQQGVLLLGLRIAGEQHGHAAAHGAHEQAVVVGIGSSAGEQTRRADDAEVEPATRVGPAGLSLCDGNTTGRRIGAYCLLAGRRLAERRDHNPADASATQHARQATDMVNMEMRYEQQRHGAHAQPAQAAVRGHGLRSGVHNHGLVRPDRQHDGVALPDVAGHHDGTFRRPARRRPPDWCSAHGHAHHDHQKEPSQQWPAGDEEQGQREHCQR
jgi:hypothetical protein